MASPGELVQVVAAALSIPESTLTQYDRNLAAEGLRTKGGRGPSAAQVTPLDAANLLLAVAGSPVSGPSVSLTASTCRKYARLKPFRKLFTKLRSRAPSLARLDAKHTLQQGVAALIEAIARGELKQGREDDYSVTLSVSGPEPRGLITVDVPGAPRVAVLYTSGRDVGNLAQAGLQQTRRITFDALSLISTMFSPDAGPPP